MDIYIISRSNRIINLLILRFEQANLLLILFTSIEEPGIILVLSFGVIFLQIPIHSEVGCWNINAPSYFQTFPHYLLNIDSVRVKHRIHQQ